MLRFKNNADSFIFITLIFFLISMNQNIYAEIIHAKSIEDAVSISEHDNKQVLLVFSAEWCKACKKLKQDINTGKYNKELNNKIICFVDIENRPDLKKEYKVDSLPDSRVLVNMIEKNQILGYNPSKYKEWLKTINE